MNSQAEEVISFWFDEIESSSWWASDSQFDDLIRTRFLPLLQRAAQAELFTWRESPLGRLAEIIVLDQFSRNAYRGTVQSFAQDPLALALAQEAVSAGAHKAVSEIERCFLLMPYMHSESKLIHVQAEALFEQFAPASNYDFELKHKKIVDRFGRYPHRNDILGRVSTEEERAFLTQPGSSF